MKSFTFCCSSFNHFTKNQQISILLPIRKIQSQKGENEKVRELFRKRCSKTFSSTIKYEISEEKLRNAELFLRKIILYSTIWVIIIFFSMMPILAFSSLFEFFTKIELLINILGFKLFNFKKSSSNIKRALKFCFYLILA